MPGAPFKASTSSPESSATAADALKFAAWRALSRALARKVAPVSSGEGRLSSAELLSLNGNPASSERNSRSLPTLPVAITNFLGDAGLLGGAGTELCRMQLRNAMRCKVQQLVELVAAKRVSLCRPLDFDEPAAAVHHHVHVGFRVRVLGIIQIQHGRSTVDAYRHRRDLAM